MTYFNSPFSKNVQTNIGQKFLQLIKKCFPSNHPLAKVVKRNNVKISYKTMPNLQKIISNHNQKILKPKTTHNPATAGQTVAPAPWREIV